MNYSPRSLWEKLSELLEHALGNYEAEALLKSIGGVWIGGGCYSSAYKVTFGKVALVYKMSRAGKEVNMPDPQDFEDNEVLKEHFLKPIFRPLPRLLVQPMCEPHGLTWDARCEFQDKLKAASPCGTCHYDAHGGNIGMYRGKVRIFDAMSYNQWSDVQNGYEDPDENYSSEESYCSCSLCNDSEEIAVDKVEAAE